MTLQSSGQISANNINVELGKSGTAQISLNDTDARVLAGKPTSGSQISFSDFYGKSNRPTYNVTFTTSHSDATLAIADSITGSYVAGSTDVIVTVNSGVYLWASTTANYGLNITGGTTGDTLTLVNNGYIIGCGGAGSGNINEYPASNGGPALNLGFGMSSCTINNTAATAYIAGGGGGGGGWEWIWSNYCWCTGFQETGTAIKGGGGAAGGGIGGMNSEQLYTFTSTIDVVGYGGTGGAIGASGTNGQLGIYGILYYYGAGGGGRILPGTGGTKGNGGGSGGGGAWSLNTSSGYADSSGTGGSGSNVGQTAFTGGGGGWGAAGGSSTLSSGGYYYNHPPGAGGKAVNVNGKTITWVNGNTTRVYGAVS